MFFATAIKCNFPSLDQMAESSGCETECQWHYGGLCWTNIFSTRKASKHCAVDPKGEDTSFIAKLEVCWSWLVCTLGDLGASCCWATPILHLQWPLLTPLSHSQVCPDIDATWPSMHRKAAEPGTPLLAQNMVSACSNVTSIVGKR